MSGLDYKELITQKGQVNHKLERFGAPHGLRKSGIVTLLDPPPNRCLFYYWISLMQRRSLLNVFSQDVACDFST